MDLLQENTHKLVDILQPSAPGRIALPINEAVLELAKALWSILVWVLLVAKCMKKHIFIPV